MKHDTASKPGIFHRQAAGQPTALQRYSAAASSSARVVIIRILHLLLTGLPDARPPRPEHISNIYALVRLADEVVDGVAREAGLDATPSPTALHRLEEETEAALLSGYSTNMIVHAFACTARSQGIDTDADPTLLRLHAQRPGGRPPTTPPCLSGYIYGSAEVVGSDVPARLPLHARRRTGRPRRRSSKPPPAAWAPPSRRSISCATWPRTPRNWAGSYFPGLDPAAFSDAHKDALVAEIRADLDAAALGIPHLAPRAAQRRGHGPRALQRTEPPARTHQCRGADDPHGSPCPPDARP